MKHYGIRIAGTERVTDSGGKELRCAVPAHWHIDANNVVFCTACRGHAQAQMDYFGGALYDNLEIKEFDV